MKSNDIMKKVHKAIEQGQSAMQFYEELEDSCSNEMTEDYFKWCIEEGIDSESVSSLGPYVFHILGSLKAQLAIAGGGQVVTMTQLHDIKEMIQRIERASKSPQKGQADSPDSPIH